MKDRFTWDAGDFIVIRPKSQEQRFSPDQPRDEHGRFGETEHHHISVETSTGRAEIITHIHRIHGGPHSHSDSLNATVVSPSMLKKTEAKEALKLFQGRKEK